MDFTEHTFLALRFLTPVGRNARLTESFSSASSPLKTVEAILGRLESQGQPLSNTSPTSTVADGETVDLRRRRVVNAHDFVSDPRAGSI